MPSCDAQAHAEHLLGRPLSPHEAAIFRAHAPATLQDQDGTTLLSVAPPARLMAQGRAVEHTHTWSIMDRIRWASGFLLLGLFLGALLTTAVVVYHDRIAPQIGSAR